MDIWAHSKVFSLRSFFPKPWSTTLGMCIVTFLQWTNIHCFLLKKQWWWLHSLDMKWLWFHIIHPLSPIWCPQTNRPFPQLIRGDNKQTAPHCLLLKARPEFQPKSRLHNVASRVPTLHVETLMSLHRLKGRRTYLWPHIRHKLGEWRCCKGVRSRAHEGIK